MYVDRMCAVDSMFFLQDIVRQFTNIGVEITAMPVPVNPRTGKPIDYIVDGNTGVLSDARSVEFPLEFTIRIRH
jgi:hypothetical protein